MTNEQLIGINLLTIIIVQGLGIFFIQQRLRNKIDFEFMKREQAVIVASLFAEWIDKPEDTKKLNQLAWEATLWLPDELASEVNKCLLNSPDSTNIKQILVDVKFYIQGKTSTLDPMEIPHFLKR
jgi:hypothetical protein